MPDNFKEQLAKLLSNNKIENIKEISDNLHFYANHPIADLLDVKAIQLAHFMLIFYVKFPELKDEINGRINDEKDKKFDIKGSSYNGEALADNVIGNWWNHKILQASSQISPVSGSIKDQVVTFLGKEKIDLYGKVYDVDHFTLKSKDMSIPKDKRLDFDIWYDRKNLMILKVSYSRMGNWEYKLKYFD